MAPLTLAPDAITEQSRIKRVYAACLFLALLLLTAAATTQAQTSTLEQIVSQARVALSEQRAADAFNSLLAYELEGAGDAGFDYWLGVAAARAGDYEQSITALERVVMVQPNHAGARLELAGVFILQNRMLEAEAELLVVEQMNPPPAARAAIQRYRQIIAQGSASQSSNAFSMIGLDLGYDSNYVNYPDSFDLFANTPLQGLAVLSEQSTNYTQLRGLHYRELSAPGPFTHTEWLTVVQSRHNNDNAASVLNSSNLQSSLTLVAALSDTTELQLRSTGGQLWLDGSAYRRMLGVSAGILHDLSERTDLVARLRVRNNDFSDSRSDNRSLQAELIFNVQISAAQRLRLQANAEQENTSGAVVRQGGDSRRRTLDVQWHVGAANARHRFNAGLGYQSLDYKDPGFAVFNQGVAAVREDSSATAHAEWTFQPSASWQFSTRLQHRAQSSSLRFFDTDQTVAQASVNFLF